MLEATVKKDYPYNLVTAHAGVRFHKGEWTRVPDYDDHRCPLLEYRGEHDPVDYSGMTKAELLPHAEEAGIENAAKLKKAELLAALAEG